MTAPRTPLLALLTLASLSPWLAGCSGGADAPATTPAAPSAASPAKPALAVTTVKPETREMARSLAANGSVAAWQEASLGAEASGLRLVDIKVNVGSRVKRGELLAEFATEMPLAEQAQARASLAEAEANLQEARGNATRARSADAAIALSPQQIQQYLSAEAAAEARRLAARASLNAADLRLRHTRVLASDDGVISFRAAAATVGAVVPQGQELFRLIRQNRLEWRAEVPAAELGQVRPGQAVRLSAPGGGVVAGKVRTVAPTVDAQTRNALVYVDVAADASLKAGMFARGEFELGRSRGLTLPRQAVALRDGFDYVFVVGPEQRVAQIKVGIGYRDQERVEILSGLKPDSPVAASGAGFLNDGDLVRVVAPDSAATAAAAAK